MRLDTRAFTSKVARRAFLLFITCALLPVSVLAILSFRGVTAQLQEQSERRLRQASKATAMALYKRLLALETALETSGSKGQESPEPDVAPPFTGVELTTADGRRVALSGRITDLPSLTGEEQRHVTAGKTVLSAHHPMGAPSRIFLHRAVDPAQPDRGIWHAEINPIYLWAPDDDSTMYPTMRLIVLDETGRPLFSSFETPMALSPELAKRARLGTGGHLTWHAGADTYEASYWPLFLQFKFLTPGWTIVVSESEADVLAPIAGFRKHFFLVVLLSVWIVLLLSVRQIRKSLDPVKQLQDGTRRVAMGHFDSRVDVAASGDEFEELAVSFNQMAGQLGRQFDALAMRGELASALNRVGSAPEILQEAADVVARHLRLAAAGVWTLKADGSPLELQASAGMTWPADSASPVAPAGEAGIGLIAAERRPYTTNTLVEDPRLPAAEWARREGLSAFVAHPLVVGDRLVGVAAGFARQSLDWIHLGAFTAAAGEIAQFIERKRVEAALQGSEEQLRQLQKMEMVGQLAGGIAHDFNNLLTVITGRSSLLLASLAVDNPARRGLEIIDATAERAAKLTRQLLNFSRRRSVEPSPVNVNEVVLGMTEILSRLIGGHIELVFEPCPDPGAVKVDRGHLEQVLVNLVVNARDAMPGGGRIVVKTSVVALAETDPGWHPGATAGPHVVLAVRDSGIGMDADTRARIFEPFFTTKDSGKGTGLGLATVLGIVKESSGSIAVDSTPGAGSTFSVYFPRVASESDGSEGIEGVEEIRRSVARVSETVLIVEDEAEVRRLAHGILEDHGYVVLSVGRGADALRLADDHAEPIHLLLTDMVIPDMNSHQLVQRFTGQRPEAAAIFMSGYTDHGSLETGPVGSSVGFLQKPFTPAELARKVRTALDSVKQPAPSLSLK